MIFFSYTLNGVLITFLCCKHSLTGPLPTILYVPLAEFLECIIHGYIIYCTDSFNTLTDHLFELFLDILTDNKYYMVEASLNCIMNRVIHDNMVRNINWLQLLDFRSKSTTDTSRNNKLCCVHISSSYYLLFHCHTLRQISRLIHVQTLGNRHVVAK